MNLRNNHDQWGAVAKFFHWSMALGILCNGIWGLVMVGMVPSTTKTNIFTLHKSVGLTILALFVLRLAWRMSEHAPPDEPMPNWQRRAAHTVHVLLYMLSAAIPISGWWLSSVAGKLPHWFFLFQVPTLTTKHTASTSFAIKVHEYLFFTLLSLLVLHVAAAVKHQLDGSKVLRRMLPFCRVREPDDISSRDPTDKAS